MVCHKSHIYAIYVIYLWTTRKETSYKHQKSCLITKVWKVTKMIPGSQSVTQSVTLLESFHLCSLSYFLLQMVDKDQWILQWIGSLIAGEVDSHALDFVEDARTFQFQLKWLNEKKFVIITFNIFLLLVVFKLVFQLLNLRWAIIFSISTMGSIM